jgi:transcription elongation factor GreA
MTVEGAQRLKVELHRLKTVERPSVIQAIAEARSHGDLSENADYGTLPRSGRASSKAGSPKSSRSSPMRSHRPFADRRASRGIRATVELEAAQSGERVTYQIVGEDEAAIKDGKISVTSPIARALIGRGEGDTADVKAPGGSRSFEILAVRYG